MGRNYGVYVDSIGDERYTNEMYTYTPLEGMEKGVDWLCLLVCT